MASQAVDERPDTRERVLNVGPGPPEDGTVYARDVCPKCGGERWELKVVPDRFYCDRCEKATLGPNTEVPEPQPEQLGLDVAPAEALFAEAPPIDEGMAWIADEMPDE